MTKDKRATNDQSDQPSTTFEDGLRELEEIADQLEDGGISLSQALELYERGVGRLKRCHQQLQEAEKKIELLIGVDADGHSATAPMENAETSARRSDDDEPANGAGTLF